MSRVVAMALLALLCGCREKAKFRFAVHVPERPYIDRYFDKDGVAEVRCGRFTGFDEEFYIAGVKVDRRTYFGHLQSNVAARIAARIAVHRVRPYADHRVLDRVEAANNAALRFWELKKSERADPEAEREAYRRRKETVL